jgi:hypothetical protein
MKLNTVLVFSALVLASGLVWYSVTSKDDGVPIIRADTSPIKIHPDDRGGMEIENKDSTIYQALRKERPSAHVENLLADNAQSNKNGSGGPINREELFAGLKTHQEKKSTVPIQTMEPINEAAENANATRLTAEQAIQDETPYIKEVIPTPIKELQIIPVDTTKKSSIEAPKARPKTLSVTPQMNRNKPEKGLTSLLAEVQGLKTTPLQSQKSTKKAAPKIAQTGSSYIQIGSLTSASAAKAHWVTRLQQFPALLKGYKLRVQNVEIAERGTYYRVQGGPVSKESAKHACIEINKRFAKSCIVK